MGPPAADCDIARATQEGIAYQVSDILTAMQDDLTTRGTTIQPAELRVDVGACKNHGRNLLAVGLRSEIRADDFRC